MTNVAIEHKAAIHDTAVRALLSLFYNMTKQGKQFVCPVNKECREIGSLCQDCPLMIFKFKSVTFNPRHETDAG
jgi:hypothetical protein